MRVLVTARGAPCGEWARLGGFVALVTLLHVVGVGLLVAYGGSQPVLSGLA